MYCNVTAVFRGPGAALAGRARRARAQLQAEKKQSKMPALQVPATAAEADSLIASGACVVNFCATWAEPCAHLNTVFAELAREHEHLSFVQVDADAFPELCERFSLEAVPAFLFLHSGKLADSVLGADVPSLVNKVKQHNHTSAITKAPAVPATAASSGSATGDAMDISESQPTASLEDRLKALTSQAPVVLFMKGDPETPRCGFSRQAVELLRGAKVQFATFDILKDEEVRQGLKAFSNWPTYPQLYGDGKLLGGLDIMKELQEEGELASSLPAAAVNASGA